MIDKFNIPLSPLMKIYDTPKMKENLGRKLWVHCSLLYTFSFRCKFKLCFQFMSILKSYLTNFWTLSCLIWFVGVVSHLICNYQVWAAFPSPAALSCMLLFGGYFPNSCRRKLEEQPKYSSEIMFGKPKTIEIVGISIQSRLLMLYVLKVCRMRLTQT